MSPQIQADTFELTDADVRGQGGQECRQAQRRRLHERNWSFLDTGSPEVLVVDTGSRTSGPALHQCS